jgi:NodT family efflux transporter outer membrane factor (OMF) lipoprotein
MRRRLAPLLIAPTLFGCAPQPMLGVPSDVTAEDWSRPAPAATLSAEGGLGALLGSAELADLIDTALANNAELLASGARVDQALALLKRARTDALPVIGASGAIGGARGLSGGALTDFDASFAAIDATLDLDLFGRNAARRRSARERARAAGFDAQAIAVGVSVQVARAFVQRATLTRRLALLDRSIAQAGELDRILRVRQREGVATRVDVGLQTIRLRQLQAERTRLVQAQDGTRTALAVLTGAEAPIFTVAAGDLATLRAPAIVVPPPLALAAGQPRIRAAEARIRAAGGDVDAARRAFYPSLRLSLGLSNGSGINPATALLQLGGSLLAPIFGRGGLDADLKLASAQQREAVQLYRQALLETFRDVEDALVAIEQAGERERLLAEIEREARVTTGLARRQYLEGDADLQRLLDAQDLLTAAEDAAALTTQERIEASLALYAVIARR